MKQSNKVVITSPDSSTDVAVTTTTGINRLAADAVVTSSSSDLFSLALNQQCFNADIPTIQFNNSTENNLFYLTNPNASGKKVRIHRVNLSTAQTGGTSSIILRLYSAPTITGNGTAVTIHNRYITASPTASVINTYKSSTTSALGTQFDEYVMTVYSQTMRIDFDPEIIIDPNNAMLFTLQTSANNFVMMFNCFWAEF